MTGMVKTSTTSVQLEPIDRLEEKLKLLLSVVDRMKSEQARAAEENRRLESELDALRSRVSASETISSELTALRQERDQIRTRVGEMLEQLEALEL